MRLRLNRKGQGSSLSGDLPAIIMIVVSIAFFLSALLYSLNQFEDGKDVLAIKQASLDAANAFMKKNAKLAPEDMDTSEEFWQTRMTIMETRYGVKVYAELVSFCSSSDVNCPCPGPSPPQKCKGGKAPPEETTTRQVVKAFPVAVQMAGNDLFVYPGIIRVTIWR